MLHAYLDGSLECHFTSSTLHGKSSIISLIDYDALLSGSEAKSSENRIAKVNSDKVAR